MKYVEIREKCPYLQNYHSKKRSTQYIVSTNNRGGEVDLTPPPPIKTRSLEHPIKIKVKRVWNYREKSSLGYFSFKGLLLKPSKAC